LQAIDLYEERQALVPDASQDTVKCISIKLMSAFGLLPRHQPGMVRGFSPPRAGDVGRIVALLSWMGWEMEDEAGDYVA
jgi:hypothetical protein